MKLEDALYEKSRDSEAKQYAENPITIKDPETSYQRGFDSCYMRSKKLVDVAIKFAERHMNDLKAERAKNKILEQELKESKELYEANHG